ncbi:hypothetical protein ACF1CY_002612 [Providencia rettgeri]
MKLLCDFAGKAFSDEIGYSSLALLSNFVTERMGLNIHLVMLCHKVGHSVGAKKVALSQFGDEAGQGFKVLSFALVIRGGCRGLK